MSAKRFQRIVRTRRLTPDEIAGDREIRKKIEKEFPPAPAPSDVSAGLSDALKEAARRSGKSVNQLGREAGISPIVIARFLSGERDIRLATADKLAHALGCVLSTD